MTLTKNDFAILRWLARRENASVTAIMAACAMTPGEARARLVALDSQRLVGGRQDAAAKPPRRVYFITAEGRRKAEATIFA